MLEQGALHQPTTQWTCINVEAAADSFGGTNVRGLGADGANDVTLGSRADKIERIARDQRDRLLGCRIEYRHFIRSDDPGAHDPVELFFQGCVELYRVSCGHVLQRAEEPVA